MKKKATLNYSLVFTFFEGMVSFVYAYGIYILLQKGFSNSLAGIIISISSFVSIFTSMFCSNFIDNNKKLNAIEVSAIISISLIFILFLNIITTKPNIFSILAFVLLNAIFSCVEPSINAYNFIFINSGVEVKFGIARAIASFSYSVACVVYGVLADAYPYRLLIIVAGIFNLLTILMMHRLNKNYKQVESKVINKQKNETIAFSEFMKNNESFIIIVLCLCGIFTAVTMTDNFLPIVLSDVGGTAKDVGYNQFIKAMFEIPGIYFFSKIEEKFGIKKVLKFASFWYPIKMLLTYLAKNTTLIYISQFFHGIPFSIIISGMVSLVNQTMNKKEAARGIALFSTSMTIGTIIASLLAGILADMYSVKTMVFTSFVIATISSLLFYLAVSKFKKNDVV